jgi:hypothetical protein
LTVARKPTGNEQRAVPRGDGGEGNRTRDTGKMDRLPIANKDGVLHLHINGAQPEAAELQRHVEGMQSKNTDHSSSPVFNPSVSRRQQQLMAIAEHDPERVSKKNRGVLKMSKSQLHDYASTKGL